MKTPATRRLLYLVALLVLLGASPALAQIKVVTSFSILADMVRNIGGDRVDVVSLVGPDGDAHVYEPTPADARAVAAAQLVVVNGLGFEGWVDRLVHAAGRVGPIVVAAEGTPVRMSTAREHAHAGHAHGGPYAGGPAPDPHAWQDLAKSPVYVRNIVDGLARIDPANATTYRNDAARYLARLAELDAWVRQQIATLPPERRKVITSHDAFGHFGDAYGLTFVAPSGYSTESDPTARGIARLIAQIRRENIRAIFIENMSNPRIIQRIADETGVAIGGRLYADALSRPGGPADSYEAMFRHNVAILLSGLTR